VVSNGKGKGHLNGRAGKRSTPPVPKIRIAKPRRAKK
jgi:hypothetical protein